jgi:hypothetical protein
MAGDALVRILAVGSLDLSSDVRHFVHPPTLETLFHSRASLDFSRFEDRDISRPLLGLIRSHTNRYAILGEMVLQTPFSDRRSFCDPQ